MAGTASHSNVAGSDQAADASEQVICSRLPDKPVAGGPSCADSNQPAAWESWSNAAFALSALSAAVMRLASSPAAQLWTPAVTGIAAINGLIAVLFLIRRPVVAIGTTRQLASCLPTMVGFGLAVRLAPQPMAWSWPAHVLFALGALVTIAAFVSLGSSFGVLPALRRVVDRGPYRCMRHPAYAGELMMAAACFIAGPSLLTVAAWLLLLPGVVWRILCEEAILAEDQAYAGYRQRVRWRLLPGVW